MSNTQQVQYKPNPCKKTCPDRSPTCHGSCKEYLDFRHDRDKMLEEKFRQSTDIGYTVEQVVKSRERRSTKWKGGNRDD